jgi:cytochrome c biogenesis protein CcmG/thiol:disulfide interchange protein DsbE
LHEDYTDQGLTVLAVNAGEKKSTVQRFVDENGYTLPTLLDSRGAVRGAYGVRVLPTTYLVDDQGTVHYVQRGYGSGLEAELRAEIESLLVELE